MLSHRTGLTNYAQLLHDLVAAHPETPTFAAYTFRALKDPSSKKPTSGTPRGFRCTAKVLQHILDIQETEKRAKV